MNKPVNNLISLIMPVFNAEKTVEKAIQSILNQSYSDFEFLIIDDASKDNSWEIIQSFDDKRIRLFRNKRNVGSLLSRNKLFSEVSGEIIVFQDADDYSSPNRLYEIVNYFETHPNTILIGSNANYFDEKTNFLKTSKKPTAHNDILRNMQSSIAIIFATSAVRNSVFQSIGGFREYFFDLGNYDYDWLYRITERFEVGNIDLPLYNIVIQNTSNSKTIQNPKKLIGHKIVQFLAQQRKDNNGWDSLRGLDLKLLENFEKFAMQPYERDKTLFLYERVEAFMGYKDYNLALRTALSAVRLDPLNLRNIRTVLYVIRKKIFSRKENAS